MNIILKSILTIGLLLLASLAHAVPNTYYVTQSGKGARNGEGLANAWSVSGFNNSANWSTTDSSNKIDPGDTVYFSGTITTEVLPKGSGTFGNAITLDGYEAGDCDPLNSVCFSSALLTGGFQIVAHDYINIYDFRMTEGRRDRACLSLNNAVDADPASHITVKRNYIYNAALNMLVSTRTGAPYDGSDYLTIEENKMVGFGKSADAAQGVNFYYSTNVIVRNNILGHEGTTKCTSANIVEVHVTQYALFEYNEIYGAPQQCGIAIKENGQNNNIIVRFNNIHDNGIDGTQGIPSDGQAQGRAISVNHPTSEDIYIYGNNIYNHDFCGMDIFAGSNNIYIWSNLIHNNGQEGLVIWQIRNEIPHNIYVYNNVFSNNGTKDAGYSYPHYTGLSIIAGNSITAKNNIFYNNRPKASTYNQAYVAGRYVGQIALEHNTYYYIGQTPTIFYGDAHKTVPIQESSYSSEGSDPVDKFADPGFANPDSNNYKLDGTNINDGVDLSTCFNLTISGTVYIVCIDDALDPANTDWTTTPPTVRTTKQGDHGVWERGAYVYSTGTANLEIKAPGGLKIVVD